MMKVNHEPELGADNRMLPVSNYGIKCMSIGLLVSGNRAFLLHCTCFEYRTGTVVLISFVSFA